MAEHDIGFTRRRLLLGAAGVSLAGCATQPSGGASIGRVVIVGGGFAGATAARYLRLWGGNVDVTLVERNPGFVSCPLSNLVIGGQRQLAEVTLGYAGLQRAGVKLVQGDVTAIDAAARNVKLASGETLSWDRLVVAPGVDFLWAEVPGLEPAVNEGRVLHAWKAGPQTVALRRQLEALPAGGVVALTVPKAPYRCPPGPYERACLIAGYLKAEKPRAKLLILDANPEITSKKGLFERAFRDHYAGIVEYRPNAELKQVSGLTAKLEFDDVNADLLNVVPPQRAGDVARNAGLVNVNARWCAVDWLTMESTAVPRVHVLGDAVFPAALMPKSAHMANQHAKLAAAAIVQLLRAEPVNPAPVLMNTCYSFVSAREAIHVATVHQYDTAEKTFKTVPGSGGVSAAASEAEGRYALAWAQNVWADALAF
jgi:sulfide dehydrogenase [flavocytochrome c] flavoprotein subunit